MNIHGAIDLETGQTRIGVLTVDAMSTIALLMSIEALPANPRVPGFITPSLSATGWPSRSGA